MRGGFTFLRLPLEYKSPYFGQTRCCCCWLSPDLPPVATDSRAEGEGEEKGDEFDDEC